MAFSSTIEFTTPKRPIPNGGGPESLWYAAHNPVIITGQRKDASITNPADFTDDSGNLNIAWFDIGTYGVTTGDDVYVKFFDSNGDVIFSGNVEVLSQSSHAFTIDYPASHSFRPDTGFINFISLTENYYVQIYPNRANLTPATYDYFSNGTKRATYFPDTTGYFEIDVQRFLREFIGCEDEYNYTDEIYYDIATKLLRGQSDVMEFSYQIFYGGNSQSAALIPDSTCYAVEASMQTRNNGGSNMAKYVPSTSGTNRAKWLCDFSRPTTWDGYPFDLSFILSEFLVASLDVLNKNEETSQDNVVIDGFDIAIADPTTACLARVPLTHSADPDIDRVDVTMINWDGSTGPSIVFVTETIKVDVEKCIPRNPVYLRWLSRAGGWSYYLFGATQTSGKDVKSLGEFAKHFTDLQTQSSDSVYLGKDSIPTLICGAEGVPTIKMDGLSLLIDAVEVQMLMNPSTWVTDGFTTWDTVRLEVGSFKIRETKAAVHKIEFKLKLVGINTQGQ